MAVVYKSVLIDPSRASGIRAYRGMNTFWEPPLNLLHVFQDTRTRPIQIGSILEHNENVGISKHGLRAYRFHMRSSKQSCDDGICHLIFDEVRRLTCPGNVNDNFHVGN